MRGLIAIAASVGVGWSQSGPPVSSLAPATSPLCGAIQTLLADPGAVQAHWGISVITLGGHLLCGIDDTRLFRPASNTKLFTTAAALALFGPSRTFTTRIASHATMSKSGSLGGDLLLVGGGDANLSRREIPYAPPSAEKAARARLRNPLETMADAMVAAGLSRVDGDVVGDDAGWPAEPYGDEWSVGDLMWGYGAPTSALSFEDNEVNLHLSAGASIGSAASMTLDPVTSIYMIQNEVKTGPAKTAAAVRIERPAGSRTVKVSGVVPLGSHSDEMLAVEDPALYAALALKSLLEARGVRVQGVARAEHGANMSTASFKEQVEEPLGLGSEKESLPARRAKRDARQATELASHESATVLEDVTVTLKVSQNLHAELLLRHLGEEFGDAGSSAQGARVVRHFLLGAGLNANDFVLFDGSGLGAQDLATPRGLTRLLAFAATQPWFAGWRAALPIGGVDGSLAHRFNTPDSKLKGRVFAKTGSLGESRALSGYVLAASGRTLIFSLLEDDHLPGSAADRIVMDRIVELIAAKN